MSTVSSLGSDKAWLFITNLNTALFSGNPSNCHTFALFDPQQNRQFNDPCWLNNKIIIMFVDISPGSPSLRRPVPRRPCDRQVAKTPTGCPLGETDSKRRPVVIAAVHPPWLWEMNGLFFWKCVEMCYKYIQECDILLFFLCKLHGIDFHEFSWYFKVPCSFWAHDIPALLFQGGKSSVPSVPPAMYPTGMPKILGPGVSTKLLRLMGTLFWGKSPGISKLVDG